MKHPRAGKPFGTDTFTYIGYPVYSIKTRPSAQRSAIAERPVAIQLLHSLPRFTFQYSPLPSARCPYLVWNAPDGRNQGKRPAATCTMVLHCWICIHSRHVLSGENDQLGAIRRFLRAIEETSDEVLHRWRQNRGFSAKKADDADHIAIVQTAPPQFVRCVLSDLHMPCLGETSHSGDVLSPR